MRQNGATSAPLFYCVSYEILCETRIKPSFFGNCLIFLSQVVRHWARAEDEKVVKYFKKLGNTRVLFYTRVVKFKPRINTGFSLYFTSFGFQVGALCHLRRAR